ncbi:MBL fold metallo-hydrolase [Desertivirga brevis]|uniref:MBL fold metallo-hydrolase n=1 Tax=Desertivirga brevis TaxID=2810310 RepID=UPI001A95FD75|nr:MBL fold metallo-hydrolase [Pedobacter sp. SYSU D00873]
MNNLAGKAAEDYICLYNPIMENVTLNANIPITLTVIGSGDAFGSGGRLTTCFHVKTDSHQFLIDCGVTSLTGLKQNGIKQEDIDTILITHFHGDHYGGLPFFLLEAAVYSRTKPITIISPPGARKRIEDLLELLYPSTKVLERLIVDFKEYKPYESVHTDILTVQAFPVIHTPAALPHGLRITVGNKIISYSGDTEWTPNLIQLSHDADLFICECNFYKLKIKGHLDYETLKQNLSSLSFKKILLTHLDTEVLNNISDVDLDCAADGMVVDL